jgi:two-component system, sensor histidine kinase and response regulator
MPYNEKGEPEYLDGAIFDITDNKVAETNLRHSEEMTRAIIENALECIIRIDEKGIIQSFNPSAEKTFGYKRDEVINRNIKFLLPEPYRSEHDEYLKKYLATGVKNIIGFARELEAVRKDGSVFPIELSVSELYQGEHRYFNGMVRDITQRKEIEKNLQKINKQSDFALDLTKAGYWHILLDDSGYYVSSEKAVAIFGDPPRPGHRYKIMEEWYANVEAGDKEAAEATLENFKGAIEGRYPIYDATFAYKRPVDGGIVWIHALAYVVRDENGKATEMYGVTQDITESKLLEAQLREASIKAEQANQAKSLFISSMSHEIRTPMNAILGYSQILERDKELIGKQRKGVESIHRAGKHLLDIINDILDFSKIEAGKMELHPHDFDLGSIVQDLLIIFSGKCKEKHLELKSEGVQEGQKVHVHAEAGKLRQVLVNLIGNGVKFTESGSVTLRVMPLAGEQFYFEVKDTGEGIAPEKLKTIFESFQQDEEGIKKGGTGLGLAIAKSIISAMGGELQVESELNKGSKFYFTLDLPSAKEDVREKDDSLTRVTGLASGLSIKTVLIDDNQDNLDVLAATLQDIGIETVEADNGPEGLELIRKIQPEIIFVDYHMPGMDGLEVTKRVKEEYGDKKIKIVMISASTFEHHREQYMKEGVHGFVGKPFLREEILGVMARLLDLEYEYEENALKNIALDKNQIDFSSINISKDLHKSIYDMANMGMMSELEELLPQIDSSCSEGPQLSAHIKDLIDQFDTDGIVKVLEKIGNE